MNVQNHCLLNLVEILYAGVTYHRPLIHRPVERQPKGVHPRNGAVGVNRVHVVSDVSGSVRVQTYSILITVSTARKRDPVILVLCSICRLAYPVDATVLGVEVFRRPLYMLGSVQIPHL